MVASCAGAALGCYLVSLRVASERASLEDVETRIVLAQRDMRVLQTEIGTRGRLAQLERWNAERARAVGAGRGPVPRRQLRARQAHPARAQGRLPGAGGAGFGARARARGRRSAKPDTDDAGASGRALRAALLHEASLKTETREVPAKPVAACPRRRSEVHGQTGYGGEAGHKKSADRPGLAAAKPADKRNRVDKPVLGGAPKPVTKPVRLAKTIRSLRFRTEHSAKTPRIQHRPDERPVARSRRAPARAAPTCRPAPADARGHAPAADVRHAGLCRHRRADRAAHPVARRVRRPCRAQGGPDRARSRSAATSSTATASRWRGRSMPGPSPSIRARSSATSSSSRAASPS